MAYELGVWSGRPGAIWAGNPDGMAWERDLATGCYSSGAKVSGCETKDYLGCVLEEHFLELGSGDHDLGEQG